MRVTALETSGLRNRDEPKKAQFARGDTRFLLSNLRGIVGENSDLRPLVFKEHDAAAAFGGENDSLPNRPLIITAFPFGIEYFPIIHFKHIVGRRVPDNRPPIPLLLEIVRR